MKYSGIKWIGNIPDDWRVIKNKFVVDLYTGNSIKDEEKDLYTDEENSDIYISSKNINVDTGELILNDILHVSKDDNTFVRAYPNDILMCIEGGSAGRKKTRLSQTVTFVNKLCCFHPTGISSEYLYYILQSPHYENEFNLNLSGLIGGVTKGKLDNFIYPLPPKEKQSTIVNRLDKKIFEINALIEIEKKQIKKLEEYKQAVITEMVTRGLDKNAPLKDSGVEWIGKIHEDWIIKRAKFIAEEFVKGSGITKEDVVIDGDIPCVRYGEIYTKYDNYFNKCATRTNLSNVQSPTFIEKGDLLFTCTGELVEEIGKNVLYLGEEKCLAGGDIIVMKHKQHPGFINYAMNCTRSQMQKSYGKAKLKVVHISTLGIGNVYICLPSYAEQKIISDYLDDFTESINEIISIKQQKICKLYEYKKSLIYEYVTGKKEVC